MGSERHDLGVGPLPDDDEVFVMGVCSPYVTDNIGRITVCTSGTRPTGTSLYAGKYIYETDTSRTLVYDGTGWVIQNEPTQSFTPTITAQTGSFTTASASMTYHRSNGYLEYDATATITTVGSAAGGVILTVPVSIFAGIVHVGSGRENAVSGKMLQQATFGGGFVTFNFDGTTPIAAGAVLQLHGRYRMTTRYS
jgi:hypothetical protein